MVAHDTNAIARRVIQRLLNGAAPDETKPVDAGEWQHVVSDLYAAHASGGTAAVRRVWSALCASQRGLAAFLAADPAPVAVQPKGCPPLPQTAQAIYAHRSDCASWLDEYIAFAQQAAPKTPRSLHEAAGLFALSLAVGRRLVLRVGLSDIHPNVFILWIGETTIHGKSTAFRVFHRLITQAGLRPLLLPEKLSPPALHEQMSTDLPPAWSTWRAQKQSEWLALRGLAAQRGWAIDEASFLFDSLKRDYNTDLLGLMLQLYECPAETGDHTISRGHNKVMQPSLSFFGVTTPQSLSEHLQSRKHWLDGLWARFAMLVPEERRPWRFFPPALDFTGDLIGDLRRVHQLFPIPRAEVVLEEDRDGKPRPNLIIFGIEPPSEVILGDGVWQAWEEYARATQDTLLTPDLDAELHGSYGRLATQAIKIAMLLATADCTDLPVRVERRHFARAQEIVERWRASLHEIWSRGITTDEEHASDKIIKLLREAGERGLLARDIYRQLHRSAADITKLLELMERSGEVERISDVGKNGRVTERWLLHSVTSVTEVSQQAVTAESSIRVSKE